MESRIRGEIRTTHSELTGCKSYQKPVDDEGEPLDPQLPSDLTNLSDTRLGKLFGEFCRCAQFYQLRLAENGVTKSIAKYTEKYARSATRLLKSGNIPDKDAEVETDPRVSDRSQKTLVAEAQEVMLQGLLNVNLMGRDAISREFTRREKTENNGRT